MIFILIHLGEVRLSAIESSDSDEVSSSFSISRDLAKIFEIFPSSKPSFFIDFIARLTVVILRTSFNIFRANPWKGVSTLVTMKRKKNDLDFRKHDNGRDLNDLFHPFLYYI